jgi:hypothetical protein
MLSLAFTSFVWRSLHFLSGATLDEGFVACCCGGEGSAGQICQFVSDFIMPENHETSLLASERMLQGEMGITTVAFVGEVVWCF